MKQSKNPLIRAGFKLYALYKEMKLLRGNKKSLTYEDLVEFVELCATSGIDEFEFDTGNICKVSLFKEGNTVIVIDTDFVNIKYSFNLSGTGMIDLVIYYKEDKHNYYSVYYFDETYLWNGMPESKRYLELVDTEIRTAIILGTVEILDTLFDI